MKIIYNIIIPFKGFKAINLFGVLFVRNEYKGRITKRTLNHESIHTSQMKEMLYILFYLWYVVEWLIKLFIYGGDAYRNISFEREAYANQDNEYYIGVDREFWDFLKYIKNK